MIAQLAMLGFNVLEGKNQASIRKTQAKSQYEYERGAAASREVATAAQNTTAMSNANIARYNQRRQNNAILKNYGNQVGEEARQAAQTLDSLNSTKFTQRLQAAGNLGAITAAAGASGVGGSSIEQVKGVEILRQQRADDAVDSSIETSQYNRAVTQTAMLDSAFNALDSSPVFADLTYKANDLVMDTSRQYKYSWQQALRDGYSGYQGNMSNLGLDLSSFMKGGTSAGAKRV